MTGTVMSQPNILLTPYYCRTLLTATTLPKEAVVQILSIKPAEIDGGDSDPVRYKVVINDGSHRMSVMLSTYQNGKVEGGVINAKDIVKLKNTVRHISMGYIVPIICSVEALYPVQPVRGQPTAIDTLVNNVRVYFPGFEPFRIRVRVIRNTGGTELKSKPGSFVSNLTFQDASGKISAVAWTPEAIRKTDKLKEGKVYAVSNGQITAPPGRFAVGSPFQIKLTQKFEFVELPDDGTVPVMTYDFVPLKDLGSTQSGTCDVLAVLNVIGEEFIIHTSRHQAPVNVDGTFVRASELITRVDNGVFIREIGIVDSSGYACRIALWADEAVNFRGERGDVLVLRAAVIAKFGGISLTMEGGSKLLRNEDIPQADALSEWFRTGGNKETFFELSDTAFGASANHKLYTTINQEGFTSISDAVLNEIGSTGSRGFRTRAYLKSIRKDKVSYNACCWTGCNGLVNPYSAEVPVNQPVTTADGDEKVVYEETELWECRVCRRSFHEPRYCYRLEVEITDGTETIPATMFDRVAESVIGESVQDMERWRVDEDLAFDEAIENAQGWYTFAILARISALTYRQTTSILAYNVTRAEHLVETVEGTIPVKDEDMV
ncbi:nucleic acid-binding protein [Calocera viscosa TUFC12733]|uniref:Nucleic acid-binding protein n=1 Tax=Calocera viscosa (strain TUFC12733) TaxID=1330018 RepID=A0A167R3A1_CALVF|nr:nucleic acid-binding protein [Calocera viscosa TUFC12733]